MSDPNNTILFFALVCAVIGAGLGATREEYEEE